MFATLNQLHLCPVCLCEDEPRASSLHSQIVNSDLHRTCPVCDYEGCGVENSPLIVLVLLVLLELAPAKVAKVARQLKDNGILL